jgi:hypothetical protein
MFDLAPRGNGRRFGRILAALGVVLALGGWTLIPFANYVLAVLRDPLGQRCLSLLHDKQAFTPGFPAEFISWQPGRFLQVLGAGPSTRSVSWCNLDYRLSEEDLRFKCAAVAASGVGATLSWVRFGEAVITGNGADSPNVAVLFAGFDPATYPVNRAAVTLALNRKATSDWRWTSSMSVHHAGLALLMAPVTGPSSLARLAARPVFQACPAIATVLRYPVLPVLGIGLTLWGLFAARRPGPRTPAPPPPG